MALKRFTKLIVGAAMLLACGIAPLASCSSFFGEDGFVIQNVTWSQNSQGDIVVVMNTTREEEPTITFTVPRGVQGVGIEDVKTSVDKENTKVTIVITYSKEEGKPALPDTIVEVPIVHGEDGKGIKDVDISNDSFGNVVIKFTYTDGTSSKPITIPKGTDGKNGNGIKSIDVDDNTDPNNIIITIHYTEAGVDPTILTLPKAKDGVGIKDVYFEEQFSTEEEYALIVTYTDNNSSTIMIPRPKATLWHSGSSSPDGNLGKEGDFYLNTASGFVYKKAGNEWIFLFSMKGTGSAVEFIVTFSPLDGIWENPQLKDGVEYKIPVKYGEYIDLNKFPTISKSGYAFDGWWTSKTNNVNSGHFTDLTPVLKDMTLYPRWSEK